MASDVRVPLDPIFAAFGVPVTVTRPALDDAPIETTGVWVELPEMEVPLGLGFQRKEPQRVLALSRVEVPTVPRGTEILAPETLGGPVKGWRVDGLERADVDLHRVYVMPDPSLEP